MSAAITADSVPHRAFEIARRIDRIALSQPVHDELVDVLHRPRLARLIRPALRDRPLADLSVAATWFTPTDHGLLFIPPSFLPHK